MGIAFRLGYAAVMVWLIYVMYAILHVDAWNDDNRATVGIFVALAGLVLFPVYFVLVYILGRLVRMKE
ncbi:hypothetical protein D7M11_03325 [Paenibacillus ginsengarvi]|uniref:Uncharacterized protein n=1 Tax=Paenibacillus ginsengarvi TaxID=400777 RepID=A0A3B0CP95_9BACL|nr:hypothetical protein D7M11_03325 [Paenibacillus ginsengarvi]